MASYRKTESGRWEASVCRLGGTARQSKTFATKAQAETWATRIEAELSAGGGVAVPGKTFADLLDRYAREVSETKRGARWEKIRINLAKRDAIASVKLADIGPPDFAAWRDRRLREVSSETVRRDWTILSSACKVAVNEWQWLPKNPMVGVKRPEKSAPRWRRISEEEIAALLLAMGYEEGEPPRTKTARVGAAMLLAIETAMRAGEICGLTWGNVDLENRVAHLAMTKNGSSRDVPLTRRAVAILESLRTVSTDERVVDLTTQMLDALFRKAKARALLADSDLHFHDTRHEGITRLARKLSSPLDLARVTGHKDLRQLLIYYNESASDIAKRLD